MKKSILMAVIIIFTIITGCQKQPTASFTTDKTTYVAGETVHLTNTSTNGKSYVWIMPDGQTGNAQNIDFTLDESEPDGALTFKLKALSSNGKKTNEIQQSITVKAAVGNVTFWSCASCGNIMPITITIGTTTKTITYANVSQPSCGAMYCAYFTDLKIGEYPFTAHDSNFHIWNGTITITKNGCAIIQLT